MTQLITYKNKDDQNIKLSMPDHIIWSFNKERFGKISNAVGSNFEFQYMLDINDIATADIKYAIGKTAIDLYKKANMPFAVCISGADSEVIARESKEIGIPFELYFMDFWGINGHLLKMAGDLAKELNVQLNVVHLSKEEAYERVLVENFKELQAEKPSYLCMPYLFENIPFHNYIIGGEGEPMKGGPEYFPLADENGLFDGLPISITEVQFRQWALVNNRACEMYFYAASPLLLKSYFYHPLLVKQNKSISTRKLINTIWPNLIFKEKTANWDNDKDENYKMRIYLRTKLNSKNKFMYGPNVCLTRI